MTHLTLSRRTMLAGFLFCGLLPGVLLAQATQPAGPERWEKTIAAFVEKDRTNPPPKDAILFVGSSSIVRWDLTKWFGDLTTINRGFGGSYISDSVYYADRIVLPYRPRMIVFYAGENDIAGGKAPQQVAEDFKRFVQKVRGQFPTTPLLYIGLKPSPSRFHLIDKFRETNRLIREHIATQKNITYLDVEKPMLGDDGRPREELFVADRLHLSDKGYEIWTALLKPHLKQAEK